MDEHPDVFGDPNFSLTQLETRDSDSLARSLEAALPLPEQLQGVQEEVEEEEVSIPDDPCLAESHYSQVCHNILVNTFTSNFVFVSVKFDDFEEEVSSSSEVYDTHTHIYT